LSRQASNISEGKKHSLSVTSGAFDAEPKKDQEAKPKDEAKPAPVKQASIELESEKKSANTLTAADFHPSLTTK
jgi:hypothetical protein